MGREMLPLKVSPRFVEDEKGKRTSVLLTIAEYKLILDRVTKLTEVINKMKTTYGI